MKKVFALLILFFAVITLSYAQDIIIKKDGEEIKAKVTELTLSEIKYKKHDNLDGPLHTIAKSEVFMIRYANGTKEVISGAPATAPKTATGNSGGSTSGSGKIEQRGSAYYQNGMRLNERELIRIITDAGDTKSARQVKAGVGMKKGGKGLLAGGIPAAIVGVIGFVVGTALYISYEPYTDYSSSGYYYDEGDASLYALGGTMMTVGAVVGAVGVACLTTGIILNANGKKQIRAGVDAYNAGLNAR